MTLTLELWQAASTATDLKKHEEGCAARYAEMATQRTEDRDLAEGHRREDREWMKAISKKLDRLMERESGGG